MAVLVPIALVAFFLAILLHLFLFSTVRGRRPRGRFEYSLLALLVSLLVWYAGNFLSLLLRQMDLQRVGGILVSVEAAAICGLSLTPALLLHTHWIYYSQQQQPRGWEVRLVRGILVVLYGQLLLLAPALERLFLSPALSPIEKLGGLTLSFLSLLTVAYWTSSYLGFRIAATSAAPMERTLFRELASLCILIPLLSLLIFLTADRSSGLGQLLLLLVQLASVFPSLLVIYHIHRYRFLRIEIHKTIVLVFVTLVTLAGYLIGIRRLADFLQQELNAPPLLVEGTLVGALLLLFSPLSRWIENRVDQFFKGEIGKIHTLVEAINRSGFPLMDLPLRRELIERRIREDLRVNAVKISLDAPPSGGLAYPLRVEDRLLGYLQIELGQEEFSRSRKEALALLADAIALDLRRTQLLQSELQMRQQLQERSHMAELGRTAATIAHHVKNPLSSMKTLLQLMQEADNLRAEQKAELAMMIAEIDRLARTVGGLLKFSRLGSSPDDLPVGPVNVYHLVESVQSLLRGDLQSRRLQLETRIALDNPGIDSNLDCLSDILINLLSNAIEASQVDGRIALLIATSEEALELLVEDQGPGIPFQIQKKLFQPFFTTKSRGTGLGLAIVKRRVEQLGGTIEVISPVGSAGTRFVIRIPYDRQGRAA